MSKPHRAPWLNFPDVIIHAPVDSVKSHLDYKSAKAGDADAAFRLVKDCLSEEAVQALSEHYGLSAPTLVSAHAFEQFGVNAIPEALALVLAERLSWPVESEVVQVNVVRHTGSSGFGRLARQALFHGDVAPGLEYVLVDDFIGQGGTLANLRGYIESLGGRVLAATVLTGKPHSSKLNLSDNQLFALRAKHGNELESWWESHFGHRFDRLTQSEARYLEHSKDVEHIRNRIAQEEQA